jgi:hypothetical protein
MLFSGLSLAPDDGMPELESSLVIACSDARTGQVRTQWPATTTDKPGPDLSMPELDESRIREITELRTRLSEAQEIQRHLRTGKFWHFATS